jgi:hypothetical protein
MDTNAFIQKVNHAISNLTSDERYLFEADMEDAIDGVIADWDFK